MPKTASQIVLEYLAENGPAIEVMIAGDTGLEQGAVHSALFRGLGTVFFQIGTLKDQMGGDGGGIRGRSPMMWGINPVVIHRLKVPSVESTRETFSAGAMWAG